MISFYYYKLYKLTRQHISIVASSPAAAVSVVSNKSRSLSVFTRWEIAAGPVLRRLVNREDANRGALRASSQPQVRTGRSSDGHCAAGACPPALLAVCARSGGQCGLPPSDAVSSTGRCVRFWAANSCERAPPARVQRAHFLGLPPLNLIAF